MARTSNKEAVMPNTPRIPPSLPSCVEARSRRGRIWDRNELTLTIAPGDIRQAAKIVQTAGYNFLEDVTAVDWYPSEPRFQISYHIVSHAMKQRVRLRAFIPGDDPVIDSIPMSGPRQTFTSARSSISSASALPATPTCAES